MGTLLQDLRYGFRAMRKNPVFTLVAVAALALGIGANTAIFSVVNAVLLKPLPFADPERLFVVGARNERDGSTSTDESYPNFKDLRAQCQSCAGMAAYGHVTMFMTTPGEEPERVRGIQTSADLFAMLGAKPELDRVFTEEEDQPGAHRVVVLSHAFWQRSFGGSRDIIGRDIPMGSSP